MKQRSLNHRSSLVEKAVVVKIKQSKGVGDVFKIKDHLQKQHHLDYNRIYCDTQQHEVCVLGCEMGEVEQIMQGFARGLSLGGHGGYRWNYKLEHRDINLEPLIRADEQRKIKEQIDSSKKERARLENKWSLDKKDYEDRIADLEQKVKDSQDRLERTEWLHFEDMKKELDQKELLEEKLQEYDVTLYKLIIRRMKSYFSR